MIVRILAEGQYEVDGAKLDAIQKLDDAVMQAIMNDNDVQFLQLYGKILELTRAGLRLQADSFIESDLILPAADTSLAEAKKLFSENAG